MYIICAGTLTRIRRLSKVGAVLYASCSFAAEAFVAQKSDVVDDELPAADSNTHLLKQGAPLSTYVQLYGGRLRHFSLTFIYNSEVLSL